MRTMIDKNGKLLLVLSVVFGLPLPALAVISGLHWGIAVALFLAVAGATVLVSRLPGGGRLDWAGRVSRPRAVLSAGLGLLLVAVLIQLVPYGRSHDNPAAAVEPAWDSERTRELAVKACFDCHSNEVEYPWYADVAPVSWAVQRHVDAGRDAVNYSEWNRRQEDAHESADTVEEGSMPPWYYTLIRPGLLSEDEKQDLIRGLEATLGTEEDEHDEDENEADDD